MGEIQQSLPGTAAAARAAVERVLTEHLGPLTPAMRESVVVGDALLATSELATNAIRHAGGITGFDAWVSSAGLCVRVADDSPAEPYAAADAGAPLPGGFGWPMLQRLATRVDLIHLPGAGKHITITLPLH